MLRNTDPGHESEVASARIERRRSSGSKKQESQWEQRNGRREKDCSSCWLIIAQQLHHITFSYQITTFA